MTPGPYSEGWPRTMQTNGPTIDTNPPIYPEVEVVPLSDAERLREALERIANELPMGPFNSPISRAQQIARAALHPEDTERTD